MSKLLAIDSAPTQSITKIPTLTIPQKASLSITDLIIIVLNWMVYLAGAVALGFLIYGGILYVTSGGDADKATKARNTILYAVIGIIVVTISFALVMLANGFAS